MLDGESRQVADKAKRLYVEKYRRSLERSHTGEFVCIEPESGDFFLGRTLDDAVNQAIDKYPNRLTHTIRVGHDAALHLGAMVQ
jgi:hypothetical protein